MTSTVPASVLIGIRDDALAGLDRFAAYLPGILDNYLRLDHLSADAAREAIEGPVERYNQTVADDRTVTVEPALVEALLDQLRTGCVSVVETGQGAVGDGLTIETPFLQLVMTRLWTEERRRGSRTLRAATLTELGDAEGIVRTHLDAVMASLDDDQRDLAARVFRYLVTPSGTKIAHTAEALAYFAGIEEVGRLRDVLEWLAAGPERVLRPVPPPTREPGPTQYEIFHDVMAPAILDWRRRYVAARERVEAERELVLAKHAAEERDRRSRARLRRSRTVAAVLALLLVTSIGAGVFAFRSRSEANERAALALYGQQLRLRPLPGTGHGPVGVDGHGNDDDALAVRSALEADHVEHVLRTGAQTLTAEYSADGRRIVTAETDGTARVFDLGSGRLLATLRPSSGSGALTSAAFSPDGRMVLVAGVKGLLALFDAASGSQLAILGHYTQRAQGVWGRLAGRTVLLTSSVWALPTNCPRSGTPSIRELRCTPSARRALTRSPPVSALTAGTSSPSTRITPRPFGTALRSPGSPVHLPGHGRLGTRFAGKDGDHVVALASGTGTAGWTLTTWAWTDPTSKPMNGTWGARGGDDSR